MRHTIGLAVLLAGCTTPEGQTGGDCADGADNDGDGLFDCLDDGCSGSPDCIAPGGDADTDVDADSDSDSDSDSDTDSDGDGDDFQFSSQSVTDGCYAGTFAALAMPGGTATDWAAPVFVPARDRLPQDVVIPLPAPVGSQTTTIDGHPDHAFVLLGAVTGLAPWADGDSGQGDSGGCQVDVSVDGSLDFVSIDRFDGVLDLVFSGFDEAACPAPLADPCTLSLDIRTDRVVD